MIIIYARFMFVSTLLFQCQMRMRCRLCIPDRVVSRDNVSRAVIIVRDKLHYIFYRKGRIVLLTYQQVFQVEQADTGIK